MSSRCPPDTGKISFTLTQHSIEHIQNTINQMHPKDYQSNTRQNTVNQTEGKTHAIKVAKAKHSVTVIVTLTTIDNSLSIKSRQNTINQTQSPPSRHH